MTAIHFDAATGRLRLDQAAFDCLIAWAQGHRDPGPELPALQDAGAIRSGAAHPTLVRGLRAVQEPVCRLRLTLIDEAGRLKAAEGWVDAGTAALLLDLPDGSRDFFAVPPDFLPAAIARVVRLGPRLRARPEPLNLAADLLEGLLLPDPVQRTRSAGRLADILGRAGGAQPASSWRAWQARMTWTGRGGSLVVRPLYVVDGEAGLFLAEFEERRATLWPTTPTAIWRLLIRLLPDTDELD